MIFQLCETVGKGLCRRPVVGLRSGHSNKSRMALSVAEEETWERELGEMKPETRDQARGFHLSGKAQRHKEIVQYAIFSHMR